MVLFKVDIRSAYRTVLVHPEDRWLLRMQWGEQLFVDTVLPFSLRSAPKLFTAVADAVEWVAKYRGLELLSGWLPADLAGHYRGHSVQWPEPQHHLPGHWGGYGNAWVASAPEEDTGIEEPGWGIARAEIMPEEGVTVLGGEAAACLQGG